MKGIKVAGARKGITPHALAGELRLFRIGQNSRAGLRVNAVSADNEIVLLLITVGEVYNHVLTGIVQPCRGDTQSKGNAEGQCTVAQHLLKCAATDADIGRLSRNQAGRGYSGYSRTGRNVDFDRI